MQLRSSAHSARRDARTDQLTTLPNRRAFFEQLEARLQSGEAMALALFDIDRFKRINDAFGHIAGDAVLRHIALAAAAQLRGGDLLARIGGEEFALLIEDSDPDAAVAAAERLIATIAAQPMTLPPELTGSPDEARLSVTISMGLARRKAGQSAENLLAEADRALYAAKNGGRNQLKLAA
jgi:diguanylate cyclase (GGDEF)-like protein